MDKNAAKRLAAGPPPAQQIIGSPAPPKAGPRICDWSGERGGCGRFGAAGSGKPAARIIAGGKWHLCAQCAALPKFAHYEQTDLERQRVRVAGRTCLQCEEFDLAFNPIVTVDSVPEPLFVFECSAKRFSLNDKPVDLDLLRDTIGQGEDCPQFRAVRSRRAVSL